MPLPILPVPGSTGAENAAASSSDKFEPGAALATLDQRKVAVHIQIQGREKLVVGTGDYGVDPDLGRVLRVQTSDRRNAPELLFVEDRWTGKIHRGHAVGCDFLINLG